MMARSAELDLLLDFVTSIASVKAIQYEEQLADGHLTFSHPPPDRHTLFQPLPPPGEQIMLFCLLSSTDQSPGLSEHMYH